MSQYETHLKTNSNTGAIVYSHSTLDDAIDDFRKCMNGVYQNGGGGVWMYDVSGNNPEDVIGWIEHCEGGYCTDQVTWEIEGLDCDNDECQNSNKDAESFCVPCNKKALDIFLTNLSD